MPSKQPLILLPPSEGKAVGGDGPSWAPGRMSIDLDAQRLVAVGSLRRAAKASKVARRKLLGVKDAALAAATLADLSVLDAPTMPAIERYTGVLYGALDHRSLSKPTQTRLDRSVVIVSGLWGAVRPSDPIPDYKLKMSASLPKLGRMSTWWRPALTDVLDAEARGRRVWNLLPKEHDLAWAAAPDIERIVVTFLDRRPDGSMVAVAHWNKLLKGSLVRHLAVHPETTVDDLRDWEHPRGYRLDPLLTQRAGARHHLRDGGSNVIVKRNVECFTHAAFISTRKRNRYDPRPQCSSLPSYPAAEGRSLSQRTRELPWRSSQRWVDSCPER